MTFSNAIETTHLRKTFGSNVAVSDLTLTVECGEVFGVLGPHGAGKTTSVKMLLGLITPTAGEMRLLGVSARDYRVRQRIGFLPEHFRFHDWLTAFEFLQLHATLYHMPETVIRQRVPELLELVGLTQFAAQKLRGFSKGMLQRIGLAQALLNEPDLIILDEPTSGLDPVGRRLVRDIIRGLKERGATVFLNSHLLAEVESVCDRVAILDKGKLIKTGPVIGLTAAKPGYTIETHSLSQETAHKIAAAFPQVQVTGNVVHATFDDARQVNDLIDFLRSNQVDLISVAPIKVSLEDSFMQLIRGNEAGD